MQSGYSQGWRLGACERIRQTLEQIHAPIPVREARVLYVPQLFEAIDWGVEAALRKHVRHVAVTRPEQVLEAADSFRPDLVLVLNGLHDFPQEHLGNIDELRRRGVKTAVWFADDPYLTDDTSRHAVHYDYVFTNELACLPLYQSIGCRQAHYLPLAVHTDLFRPIRPAPVYAYDICFIGMGFFNRIRLFDELAPFLQDKKVIIAGFNWHRLSRYAQMARFIQDRWIPVPETVHYYNGAKIVINLHRTIEPGIDNRNSGQWPAVSVNPRTFEMSACGAFQLTDVRSDLATHYAIGSEMAVYRNAGELMQLIDHYLKHEHERNVMAARGYRRTIRSHSFTERIGRLLDLADIR